MRHMRHNLNRFYSLPRRRVDAAVSYKTLESRGTLSFRIPKLDTVCMRSAYMRNT